MSTLPIQGPSISPRHVYLALGIFSVGLLGALGYVMHVGARVSERYVPLVRASDEIKLDATLAHLWFEEILSGDRHESLDEVRGRMIAGDEGLVALKDRLLRAKARRAAEKLAEFEAIADERRDARQGMTDARRR